MHWKPRAQTHKVISRSERGSTETSLHLFSEFNQLEGANKLPLNLDVQFSKAVMLFTPNNADGISPEWPLQRGIFPTFSPDCLFQDKSPPQQDTGWRLPDTAVSKAFLSTVQTCTRVPAPAEASGVPLHSLSCYSPEGNQILQSFNCTNSYPKLLPWPGVGMSIGDSEMAQCKSIQWICQWTWQEGWWLGSTTCMVWLGNKDLINKSRFVSEKLASLLKFLRKSLGLLKRQTFECVPWGKIASLKKRIQPGLLLLLLLLFHLTLYFDIMPKL